MTTTTPARLSWLTGEVRSWQAAGLIGEDQADAILAGYAPGHRLSLVRLLLAVGACFVGVGVLWLVAANLESLSPTARVVLVATVWLTALAGGEVLHSRSAPAPVVGAVRLLAALLVGALVFQAAQSLQVPAYEPFLLACWAAAALVHAYAAGAVTPLLAGVVTGTVYTLWAVLGSAPSGVALVLTLATVGLAAVGLAAVHDARTPEFARVWRLSGVGLLLLSLVVGAVPGLDLGSESLPLDLVVGLVATALLVGAGLLVGDRLALWQVGTYAASDPTGQDVVRAIAGLAACATAAVGVAVVGTWRESTGLVALATVALVATTALQAFTVFAPVLEGAWLFLLLGALLVAVGLGFDRMRRQVAAAL
jgi:uncharacterized membrane protein